MVTKRKEIIIVAILIIVAIAISAIIITNNSEDFMGLTREQHQLLEDSLRPVILENMNSERRFNAFSMLDAMREIGFVENGGSSLGNAKRILYLLELGVIRDFTLVEYDIDCIEGNPYRTIPSLVGFFDARFTCENGEVYYVHYNQTWGLQWVRRGDRRGEAVFDSHSHTIVDGRIVERENPRGGMVVD